MSLKQAAEQALEALRYTTDHLPAKTGVEREVDDAITALQVALSKPKREWVGLTDQERADCWSSSAVESAISIEQALKEKNT